MKDIKLNNGEVRRCFILKEGEAATIAIPIRKLMRTDYMRLKNIEAQGGEMLKVMRDYKLDNGRFALKQYEPLFEIVHKPRKERKHTEEQQVQTSSTETQETEQPKKRGPGRPPKSESASD